MKKPFEVLKTRPQLPIRLTRDSVCPADDCATPHEKKVSVHSFVDPVALVSHLAPGYLPSVTGAGHKWECKLNGQLIATISPNQISPRVREVVYAEDNHLHFTYRAASH